MISIIIKILILLIDAIMMKYCIYNIKYFVDYIFERLSNIN